MNVPMPKASWKQDFNGLVQGFRRVISHGRVYGTGLKGMLEEKVSENWSSKFSGPVVFTKYGKRGMRGFIQGGGNLGREYFSRSEMKLLLLAHS